MRRKGFLSTFDGAGRRGVPENRAKPWFFNGFSMVFASNKSLTRWISGSTTPLHAQNAVWRGIRSAFLGWHP